MHKSCLIVFRGLFLLPLFCVATAQAQTVDQISVSTQVQGVVDGWARVEVKLKNDSSKTITAWAWSVEARYVGGSTKLHSGTVDVVSDLLGPDRALAFRPGTSRTFQDSLPLGENADLPTSAVASLTMVVFDDDTAIGDRLRIGRLAASRSSLAALEAEELQEVQKAVKDSSPKDAIRAIMVDREAKRLGGGLLRQILLQLENNAPPDAVESAQAAFRTHQALLVKHSKLEVK
jgi:hypothetical protein